MRFVNLFALLGLSLMPIHSALASLSITLTSPANGATVSGTINVSASASGRGITQVTFYVDNWAKIGVATSSPYQISYNTASLANGSHQFFATVTSSRGGTVASQIDTVTVSNLASPSPSPSPSPNPTQTSAGACTPISPISLTGYDPLSVVEAAKIPSGPFAGGFTVAQNDTRLNWYFANIGLLGFVDEASADVKTYLNLYLANLNADFSINDVYFNISNGAIDYSSYYYQANGAGQYADSDDSYAATFLSLAARYYAVTCDSTWLNSVIPNKNITVLSALKSIATNNLVNSQWPNGLIHVFQSASAYYIGYTEDNSESYRGLSDFAALLQSIGDSSASTYSNTAANVASAIQNIMYSSNLLSGSNYTNLAGFYYYWGDASSFSGPAAPLDSPLAFYPDGTTQVFPQAYRLGLAQSMYGAGWTFLNTEFPNYTTAGQYDSDPWTIIGFAAAVGGNSSLAQQMQTKTTNVYNSGTAVPINDWSFYRRISLILQKGILY